MKFGSAYYVTEPVPEVYVFIDEEPSDLPAEAVLIVETNNEVTLLDAFEPYLALGMTSFED